MSRTLPAGIVTEILKDQLRPIVLMKAEFDSGDLNLWTGIGPIVFDGDTYTGAGDLISVSEIEEVSDIEARGVSFGLSGVPASLRSLALTEDYQGRPLTGFFGTLEADGTLTADPAVIFKGNMDVMSFDNTGETMTFTLQVENRLIDLRRVKTRRYTSEDQKTEFSGDLGCDFVASLQEKEIIWGRSSGA